MTDSQPKDYWAANFESAEVSFDELEEKLIDTYDLKDETDKRILGHIVKFVISDSHEGPVTLKEFRSCVQRFGTKQSDDPDEDATMEDWFGRVRASLFDAKGDLYKWFHGPIERSKSEELLGKVKGGRYLVRFSSKYPSKLTLAYTRVKEKKTMIKNCLIHNTAKGFSMDTDPTDKMAHPSVNDLLKGFGRKRLNHAVSSRIWKDNFNNTTQDSKYTFFPGSGGAAGAGGSNTGTSAHNSAYSSFDVGAASGFVSRAGNEHHSGGASMYSTFDSTAAASNSSRPGQATNNNYTAFSSNP